jgi:hypothetical protein
MMNDVIQISGIEINVDADNRYSLSLEESPSL